MRTAPRNLCPGGAVDVSRLYSSSYLPLLAHLAPLSLPWETKIPDGGPCVHSSTRQSGPLLGDGSAHHCSAKQVGDMDAALQTVAWEAVQFLGLGSWPTAASAVSTD